MWLLEELIGMTSSLPILENKTAHLIFKVGSTHYKPDTNTELTQKCLPLPKPLFNKRFTQQWHMQRNEYFSGNPYCCTVHIVELFHLSGPELFFFLILAHSVYKMWIIQEPNTLELWNKLHSEKKRRLYTMFKIFSTYICWINIRNATLEVSSAVRQL